MKLYSTVWDLRMWLLVVLTRDRINKGFLIENVWPFCQAQKKWP